MIVILISVIVFVGYALLITAITIGWLRLKVFRKAGLLPSIRVSVIVAVRNETANIETLLTSLMAQDYPAQLLEIIIVDDHSTDSSSSLVERFIAKKRESLNLKLIRLEEEGSFGKKAAIDRGIQKSEGELIVITDADCTSDSHWISTLAAYYAENHPKMILGPVRMTDNGSIFGKLQSVEFMSLISSAAGSCNGGFPILSNGANLAFTRLAYESCGGFSGNLQYSSGDDMFLMTSIKKKFGAKAICFLRSEDAIVTTPASVGFRLFIQQRLRWVSKSRGYTDSMLITTSILVFLTNVCLVLTALAAIVSPGFIKLFLALYVLKMSIDLPLMLSYSRFQRSKTLLWLFLVMELLNAVYTLLIGIAGNVGKYEWKERQVSSKVVER